MRLCAALLCLTGIAYGDDARFTEFVARAAQALAETPPVAFDASVRSYRRYEGDTPPAILDGHNPEEPFAIVALSVRRKGDAIDKIETQETYSAEEGRLKPNLRTRSIWGRFPMAGAHAPRRCAPGHRRDGQP